MDLQYSANKIWIENEEGKTVGEVDFSRMNREIMILSIRKSMTVCAVRERPASGTGCS